MNLQNGSFQNARWPNAIPLKSSHVLVSNQCPILFTFHISAKQVCNRSVGLQQKATPFLIAYSVVKGSWSLGFPQGENKKLDCKQHCCLPHLVPFFNKTQTIPVEGDRCLQNDTIALPKAFEGVCKIVALVDLVSGKRFAFCLKKTINGTSTCNNRKLIIWIH